MEIPFSADIRLEMPLILFPMKSKPTAVVWTFQKLIHRAFVPLRSFPTYEAAIVCPPDESCDGVITRVELIVQVLNYILLIRMFHSVLLFTIVKITERLVCAGRDAHLRFVFINRAHFICKVIGFIEINSSQDISDQPIICGPRHVILFSSNEIVEGHAFSNKLIQYYPIIKVSVKSLSVFADDVSNPDVIVVQDGH